MDSLITALDYRRVSEQFCLQTEPRGIRDPAPEQVEVTRPNLVPRAMGTSSDHLQCMQRSSSCHKAVYSSRRNCCWLDAVDDYSWLVEENSINVCMTCRRATRMTVSCSNKSRVWLWIISSLRISIVSQWAKGKMHYRWLSNWPQKILEI